LKIFTVEDRRVFDCLLIHWNYDLQLVLQVYRGFLGGDGDFSVSVSGSYAWWQARIYFDDGDQSK